MRTNHKPVSTGPDRFNKRNIRLNYQTIIYNERPIVIINIERHS